MKKFRLLLLFTLFSFLFIFLTVQKTNDELYSKEVVNVNKKITEEELLVFPSGESCGIKILSDGILVIAVTDINNSPSPASLSGIKPGDFVKKLNGIPLKSSKDFIKQIRKLKDSEVEIEYERMGETKKAKLKPVLSNGEYAIGMWVRDSIAGLGTLTYYSIDKNKFAALGHSITDVDTREIMPVKDGTLVFSEIISVKRGENGIPGSLTGIFSEELPEIGTITENSEFGLFGNLNTKSVIPDIEPVPIGFKKDVSLGKAHILSTIGGSSPKAYEVEIIKINKQNKPDIKGLVIKVTDRELLEKTGGIIQGMSGSPLIQNGKLIGAVTHVFVNDPTRGYGIFIENMLAEAEKIK